MKLTKATMPERAAYAATRPVYPLYGFVMVDGHRCAIEFLGYDWDAGNPQYEVMAPDGLHFDGDYTHSLLCANLKDLRERVAGTALIPCTVECS